MRAQMMSHGRKECEKEIMGKYVFGRSTKYLEKKAKDRIIMNRDLLTEIMTENSMIITKNRGS